MHKLNPKTKVIFITGGVFSSLGKGIAAASLGCFLKCFDKKVMIMKFDPYFNVDAGTMSPEQHGEVYVTKDGNETDLDIGNYERYLNIDLPNESNLTSGKIYLEVLKKERNGEFLGSTIQVVPHITTYINNKIIDYANKYESDFLIVEIGGTIGDIESVPYIEALRQFKTKNSKQALFIHCVPLINLLTSSELKTKPIQHSIKELKSLGIFPDMLFIRSVKLISEKIKEKIESLTGIYKENIFSLPNVKYTYLLPDELKSQGVEKVIFKAFNLDDLKCGYSDKWKSFVELIKAPKKAKVEISLICKYLKNTDAYLSLVNSLQICAFHLGIDLELNMLDSRTVNERTIKNLTKNSSGILVPGGFGKRDVLGKIASIKYARESKTPFLGVCLGMQLACIEYAQNVLGLEGCNSEEFEKDPLNPIIHLLKDNDQFANLGATMRLGQQKIVLKNNSLASRIYGTNVIFERHRHRFEFNNVYLDQFEKAGFIFSGKEAKSKLVEVIELNNHPFFIATQYHPEFNCKTIDYNPIFKCFIEACLKHQDGKSQQN